jgi:hypothetical protein
MLKLFARDRHGYCNGATRRSFLQVGAGLGGLTLAGLLRAEAAAGVVSSQKAVINIHLAGGPSHQDIFDLKPSAPVEYRGEFNPIKTNVAGIEICEHLPRLAQMADKWAVIRSLVGSSAGHSNYQTHSGFNERSLENVGGRPALGSIVSYLQGPSPNGAPAFVSHNGGSPGFLGPSHAAYKPDGPGRKNLSLQREMPAERLDDRTQLLSTLDRMRRDMDRTGKMEAMDAYTLKAAEVVTSGTLAEALDVSKEDKKSQARYGGREGQNFLLARRLVEAGVRVVTFSWGGWDTHSNNFNSLRKQLPQLDIAMSALIDDLHQRGLQNDVSIVLWGEFGRTPRVNNSNGGRDHWPKLSMAFLAGGGMRCGQTIGSSTKYAEEAADRPLHFQEVHATLLHNLGINPQSQQIVDPAGRPQYLLEYREPIRELI